MKQTQSREWGLSERHINNPGDSPDVTDVTTRLTSWLRDIVTSRVRSGECHPELRLSFVVWLHQVRSVIVRRQEEKSNTCFTQTLVPQPLPPDIYPVFLGAEYIPGMCKCRRLFWFPALPGAGAVQSV